MKKTVIAAAMLFGFVTPVHAGFQEGKAAFDKKDYATAFREFKPLAEQGDVAAQFVLGTMYAKGWGVPKDDRLAAYWLSTPKGSKTNEGVPMQEYLANTGVGGQSNVPAVQPANGGGSPVPAAQAVEAQNIPQAMRDSMPGLVYLPRPNKTYTPQQCGQLAIRSFQAKPDMSKYLAPGGMNRQMAIQDQLIAFFVQTPEISAWTKVNGIANCPLEAKAEVWADAIGVPDGSFSDPMFVQRSRKILADARERGSKEATERINQRAQEREKDGAITIFGFEMGAPLNLPECEAVGQRQACFKFNLLRDNGPNARVRDIQFPKNEEPGVLGGGGSFGKFITAYRTNDKLDGLRFEISLLDETRTAFKQKFGSEKVKTIPMQNNLGGTWEGKEYSYSRDGVDAAISCLRFQGECVVNVETQASQVNQIKERQEKAGKGRVL